MRSAPLEDSVSIHWRVAVGASVAKTMNMPGENLFIVVRWDGLIIVIGISTDGMVLQLGQLMCLRHGRKGIICTTITREKNKTLDTMHI